MRGMWRNLCTPLKRSVTHVAKLGWHLGGCTHAASVISPVLDDMNGVWYLTVGVGHARESRAEIEADNDGPRAAVLRRRSHGEN